MKIIPHHLILAAQDDRLRLFDQRVYIIAQSWLSDDAFLPIRVSALAGELCPAGHRPEKWRTVCVGRALRRLVTLGYFDRGPDERSGDRFARHPLKTYRLRLPVPRVSTGATSKAA